jgi:ubiquinone/menaquinone biosynthesis C-methylase UbiE
MPVNLTSSSRRIADDAIYLSEDRRNQPKAIFVQIANFLNLPRETVGKNCLDIGCATGDLLHYLNKCFPNMKLFGMDISTKMIDVARERLPMSNFYCEDILSRNADLDSKFDYCIISGVLNCFDDIKPAIENLIKMTKPGGQVIILDMINNFPVDVIMRHRRSDQRDSTPWEMGWNYHSKSTFIAYLDEHSERVKGYTFIPFYMPFDIARKEDPMRTWTIQTTDNQHQLVNGAMQLVNLEFLIIDL